MCAPPSDGPPRSVHPELSPALGSIATLVGAVTGLPLTSGNEVEPLANGEQAYAAMLKATDGATRSVGLATYIFDRGVAGERFVGALARAVARGVQVRVLIDGVGVRYSRPPFDKELRAHGIPVARFLPSLLPFPHPYLNLRNHRKLMLVDGAVGFCGGMNVRDEFCSLWHCHRQRRISTSNCEDQWWANC